MALMQVAAGLGLAASVSAVYQAVASCRDSRAFPPPGRLIDVGGRNVHLLEAGAGDPAIVIIPALGDSALLWTRIQRTLAASMRVYVYDRAGIGWSDPPAHARRTLTSAAEELRRLLEAAEIKPPHILVGHSLGGVIARRFAVRNPGTVAGMVLVDSSHEQQATRLRFGRWRSREVNIAWALRRQSRPLGLRRLAASAGMVPSLQADIDREVPPEFAAAARAIALSSRQRRAVVHELLMLATSQGEPPALGSMPMTVITAPWDPVWEELQAELAVLSTNSRHVTAPQASHYVHLDQPDLVVREVRELVIRIDGGNNAL